MFTHSISYIFCPSFDAYSDLSGTQWLPKDDLQQLLVEEIADIEYDNFVKSMERLVGLPYSHRSKAFIMTYRKPLMTDANTYDTLKPQYDADGRMFVTTYGKA